MPPLQENAGCAVPPDSVWAGLKERDATQDSQLTALAEGNAFHKKHKQTLTHLHRAEDTPTGHEHSRGRLGHEPRGSSERALPVSTSPLNVRLKHFNFKTVILLRELRGRVWETQTRHY